MVRRWLRRWANLRVSVKLMAGMLLIAGVGVAIGVTGLHGVSVLQAGSEQLYSRGTVPATKAAQALAAMHRTRIEVRNHMLAADAQGKARALRAIQAEDERVATELAAFLALNPSARERQLVEQFQQNWASYTRVRDEQMIPLSNAGKIPEAGAALNSRQDQARAADAAMNDLFDLQVNNGAAQMARNRRAAATLSRNILLLAVSGLLLSVCGFVFQLQRQAGRLERLAMQDELTGLANRRQFVRDLRTHAGTGRACVALLDLNGFKNVNDRFGHHIGDRLLIGAAGRLVRAVGDTGSVARMGGDEFAVLLPDATDAVAATVADRVAQCLGEPIRAGELELLIGASIGLARGADMTESHEALRRADIAMYAAKERGERYRWYTPELDRRAHEKARIGAELRTAFDAGQLRLVYQPIVELPLGRVVAVEALLRWHHPERGMISPAEFIPIAEGNGMIVEIGAWVLQQACRQAAQWRAVRGAEAPQRVSVNISARQLTRPGLAAVVASALAESGLPGTCLTIEVTETAVFEAGHALSVLHELRTLGVQIALDDFGTGHSSLTLLQTVPAQVLKVDKSFVDEITKAGRQAVIATALIEVANGLGMTAVAEGVETREQAAELYRLGYRLAQGYYFGRPSEQLAAAPAVAAV